MKKNVIRFLFIIFVLIFVVIYALSADILRLKSYNILTKLKISNSVSSDNVALVVIDDKSLQEIGRWPWSRKYYLEIFDFFENYTKAKLVGYDALIMAPDSVDPKSDEKFFSQVSKFKKLVSAYSFLKEDFEEDVDKNEYNKILNSKLKLKVIDKRKNNKQQENPIKSFTALQKIYFKNISDIGAVDLTEDMDGYIREANTLVEYNGNLYPSLALVLYSKYTGVNDFILTDNYFYGLSEKYTLKVPVINNNGYTYNYINYYDFKEPLYSHDKYSASDVISSYRAIKNNKKPILNPEIFNDKVVFVGANANAQALNDVKRVPTGNLSGIDLLATNFNNLIDNKFYKMPSEIIDCLICLCIFILIFYIVITFPIIKAISLSGAVMLAYFVLNILMFKYGIAYDLILPELYVFIALGCAYSYKYLIEGDRKEKIQKAMGIYLSQDVMEKVVKNIDNIKLGGKREDITVLFADIRNFTSISEGMDANSVTTLLNEYFSAMVPIIEQNNGVLNKFMGDAILAIFGEPKRSENHALDAILCADQMLKKVKYFQEKWVDEGKPKIEIGIGISSGEAFIGNIGSKERLEYTVIGDTVNTASRIENYNKVYKTNFLISESTYQRTKKYIDVITISKVVIRGKTNKVDLYEVVRVLDKGI